ncbi:MAG: NAD(P)-dependent dehydrogenase (short-subunit alcohol dehydrogenase family) [Paracoccaceae bacterium]|jgi:NAD(P)-dependent dehydrogenase (short-subunit alcohol dehydrogenase family)
MSSLTGKTAIVTGAGRGLGKAMAQGLVDAGANVTLVELDQDVLEQAAAEIGDGCIAAAGDVSNPDDAKRIVEETIAAFGGLHILVNNAGLGPERFRDTDRSNAKMIWEIDLADWRLYLDVNTTGHFIMTQAVMPHLLAQDWGRIVNVTTSLDTMTNYTNGAYGPSKAGAEALATMIAGGVDGTGVTCNVLIPGGPADTRMISATGVYENRDKLIQPDVMVPPLLQLVSDEGGAINNRRFRAALWNTAIDAAENIKNCGDPIAWPQLGGKTIRPDDDPRGNKNTGNENG